VDNAVRSPVESNAVARVKSQSLRGKNLISSETELVSLAVGEPSFDTPRVIIDAQIQALNDGHTHYSPHNGHPGLIDAILKTAMAGQGFTADNIVVTHGGAAGLGAAILGMVNPGDVVLLEDPTYSLYLDAVNMAGASAKKFSRGEDGSFDFDKIEQDAKTAKLIILCHPSNPTGFIIGNKEWEAFAGIVQRNGLYLLCDEAYEGLTYDGSGFTSALEIQGLKGRLMVSRTFSKKYAMTGWRLGYLAGEADWIASAGLIHRTFNGSLNTANQMAGAVALQQANEDAERMRVVMQQRRDLMESCLRKIPSIQFKRPDGAFYFWVRYPEQLGASTQVSAAAHKAGVLVRRGEEFGASGKHALRLSYATDDQTIMEGVARLARVLG
jgi:aspartate aminotransferase